MSANLKKAQFSTAKDNNGDPAYLCLDANGALIVSDSSTPGTCVKTPYACIDLTETAGVSNDVDIGEVTIATGEQFNCFEFSTSSNVDAVWTLVYIDDADGTPAETQLFQYITGPGAPNYCCKLNCLELDTTGGTGTQKVVIRAKAIDPDCLGPALGCVSFNQLP